MSEIMTEAEALQTLKDKGSLYAPEDGYHFKGTSGKHISGYCNIDPVLPFPALLSRMTQAIVGHFKEDDVETVIVPATGGIPLSQWGPHHLQAMTGKEVLGVWADKAKPEGFIVDRAGFAQAIKGRRVLVLEDIINTMYSIKQVIALTRELGGEVLGVGSVVANRGVTAEALGVPTFYNLATFAYDAWEEENCELCAKNVPMVIDIGHGDSYAEAHPDYPTRRVLTH
jgi:orotate phosphoribosyltransferase